jgi:uncharacterized protein Yka (UPF0111/DUF47 family)
VRGGSRTAHDLQQAENEARGEIIDLNSGMDRIANAANSAAEKASSPSAANRCEEHCPEPFQRNGCDVLRAIQGCLDSRQHSG